MDRRAELVLQCIEAQFPLMSLIPAAFWEIEYLRAVAVKRAGGLRGEFRFLQAMIWNSEPRAGQGCRSQGSAPVSMAPNNVSFVPIHYSC